MALVEVLIETFEFLYHQLLRDRFLDNLYECFENQPLANQFMTGISLDTTHCAPLTESILSKPNSCGRTKTGSKSQR